ncbi:MAG: HTH domain-containing protein [Candidatus Pacearchaeota archaeon]|nr:HTH domain-containing protein [Candidatus Pacearchaeota archaeon]
MAEKLRIKRINVKIAPERNLRSSRIGEGLEKGKSAENTERFIIPGFAALRPFSLEPLPFDTKLPAFGSGIGYGIKEFRKLLSDEKARILVTVKNKKPASLYHLAKMLDRDFKAVRQDVKMLEKFGFLKLVAVKEKGKKKLKPVLALDKLEVIIEI